MSKIVSFKLNESTNINIFQGTYGKYYHILENNSQPLHCDLINYDINFPLDWALNRNTMNSEEFETGPTKCRNCKYFGYLNGVFISYCANCAQTFEYKRGNGVIDTGEEINENMVSLDLTNFNKENSMWNTYLKNITINEIGDSNLLEEYELYKDLPDLISESDDESIIEKHIGDLELDYEYDNCEEFDEENKFKKFRDKFLGSRHSDKYF